MQQAFHKTVQMMYPSQALESFLPQNGLRKKKVLFIQVGETKIEMTKVFESWHSQKAAQNSSLFDWLSDVQHMCTFLMAVSKISIVRGNKPPKIR